MEVKIKDRKDEAEYLRMALNMAELYVGYEQCELILRIQKELNIKKGEFTIMDSKKIYHKWRDYWTGYFEKQKEIKS